MVTFAFYLYLGLDLVIGGDLPQSRKTSRVLHICTASYTMSVKLNIEYCERKNFPSFTVPVH